MDRLKLFEKLKRVQKCISSYSKGTKNMPFFYEEDAGVVCYL
ncbi:MAG: hypothetical protein RMJ67_02530 [Elusimicrobiota bacterium]|nr:hypothetical protein [Endomicrobiia bacterium]MDW8165373.1 hypothetical protein [Elusimicrobiota bacterium]